MAGVFQDFGNEPVIDISRWFFVYTRPTNEMVKDIPRDPTLDQIDDPDLWTCAGTTKYLIQNCGLETKFAGIDFRNISTGWGKDLPDNDLWSSANLRMKLAAFG